MARSNEQAADLWRYEAIAHDIEAQIASGVLRPGDRAPSVRELSRSAGASIATIAQAYLRLEQRGLLEARPRSGYFVVERAPALAVPRSRAVRGGRPRSVAAEVIDTVLAALARPDVVSFGSAIAASTRHFDRRLNAITREVLRSEPDLPNRFIVPPGDQALRREVARRMSRHGAPVGAEDIVVTAGALEAIMLTLRVLCGAGDTVLVESPTYFGILQAIEHLQLRVVEVPNRPGAGIDLEAVARMAAHTRVTAAVLMPNFNNPTGALTPDDAKRELVRILAAHEVPIIEDDVYGDLPHGTERPRTLRAFGADAPIITCGSVSKSLALGYRLGWAVSPEFAAEIARFKFCSSVAVPSLQQQVVARYFASASYERDLRKVRATLAPGVARFRAAVARYFPPGTRVSAPDGGVALWLQLPGGGDGLTLFHHALAERIGIMPGIVFSASGAYRDCIRLSAGVAWTPAVEEALRVLGRLAGRLAGQSPSIAGA